VKNDMEIQINEQTTKLFEALAQAQLKMTNPKKNKTAKVVTKSGSSYQYSYCDLDTIIETIRQPLSENGLAIIQMPINGEQGKIGVKTILTHKDGGHLINEFFVNELSEQRMNAVQAIGSVITYLRRYGISAMLNLASEEDTDAGNLPGKGRDTQAQPKKPQTPPTQQAKPTPASQSQRNMIFGLADKLGFSAEYIKEQVKQRNNLGSFTELTLEQAKKTIDILTRQLENKQAIEFADDYDQREAEQAQIDLNKKKILTLAKQLGHDEQATKAITEKNYGVSFEELSLEDTNDAIAKLGEKIKAAEK